MFPTFFLQTLYTHGKHSDTLTFQSLRQSSEFTILVVAADAKTSASQHWETALDGRWPSGAVGAVPGGMPSTVWDWMGVWGSKLSGPQRGSGIVIAYRREWTWFGHWFLTGQSAHITSFFELSVLLVFCLRPRAVETGCSPSTLPPFHVEGICSLGPRKVMCKSP